MFACQTDGGYLKKVSEFIRLQLIGAKRSLCVWCVFVCTCVGSWSVNILLAK